MRVKIFFFMFITLMTLFVYKTPAQSAGFNLTLGFPMNEFRDNVKRTGIGGSLQVLLGNSTVDYPYTFGFDIGYINYGIESRHEPFSSSIPDVIVDVSRTNNIVNFHFVAQIIPPSGIVRPYLEILVGGAYLYTETSVNSWESDSKVASTKNFDDWAWSYGAGAGFLYELVPDSKFDNRLGAICLDFKARYLNGTEAQYLKQGSVIIQPNEVIYNLSKSKTDLLTFNIGAVVYFNNLFDSH